MKEYELVKKLMYQTASRFSKKHGNWLVKYLPQRQVIIMDTWNGHIYQADMIEKSLVDDGHVDCQLNGRIHSMIAEPYYRTDMQKHKVNAVNMWKLFLLEDFELK